MFIARNSYSKAIKSIIFYQQGINNIMNTLTTLIPAAYVFKKKYIYINQSDKNKKSKKNINILLISVTSSISWQYFSLTITRLKFSIKKVLEVISQMGTNHRQISQNDGYSKFKNTSFFNVTQSNSKALLIKSALALITKNNHEKALLIKKKHDLRLQKEKLKQNCNFFQIYILSKLLVRKLTMLQQVINISAVDIKKIYRLFWIVFTINIENNTLINSSVMNTNAK
ncbi:hypothetical protein [Frischella perrara]|uniref:hypothetical protein n=1 Tax=Frischella perrara TaxID=1267021 RepID=UPI0023EFC8AD|nr:hypothetical protein [Frischella perrara]